MLGMFGISRCRIPVVDNDIDNADNVVDDNHEDDDDDVLMLHCQIPQICILFKDKIFSILSILFTLPATADKDHHHYNYYNYNYDYSNHYYTITSITATVYFH